ncbi:MAG: hypothetical protein ACJARL_003547, partial [Halopseudomonas sp.]
AAQCLFVREAKGEKCWRMLLLQWVPTLAEWPVRLDRM